LFGPKSIDLSKVAAQEASAKAPAVTTIPSRESIVLVYAAGVCLKPIVFRRSWIVNDTAGL